MSEMVERMARAIHHAEYDEDTYPFDREDDATKKLLRAQARAAIKAMHEPTPEVEAAYLKACDESGACLWRTAWRVMIDAAAS